MISMNNKDLFNHVLAALITSPATAGDGYKGLVAKAIAITEVAMDMVEKHNNEISNIPLEPQQLNRFEQRIR